MTTQFNDVTTLENNFNAAMEAANDPIKARENRFNDLNKIITKANNAYGSTDAPENKKEKLQKMANVITGAGVKRIRLSDGKLDPKHISISHQSFVNKLNNDWLARMDDSAVIPQPRRKTARPPYNAPPPRPGSPNSQQFLVRSAHLPRMFGVHAALLQP